MVGCVLLLAFIVADAVEAQAQQGLDSSHRGPEEGSSRGIRDGQGEQEQQRQAQFLSQDEQKGYEKQEVAEIRVGIFEVSEDTTAA